MLIDPNCFLMCFGVNFYRLSRMRVALNEIRYLTPSESSELSNRTESRNRMETWSTANEWDLVTDFCKGILQLNLTTEPLQRNHYN